MERSKCEIMEQGRSYRHIGEDKSAIFKDRTAGIGRGVPQAENFLRTKKEEMRI